MTNLERIKMSVKNINLTDAEFEVYLLENNLAANLEYTINDKLNILKTSLAILEEVGNDINLMKTYKTEDISVSDFAKNIQSRIEQLTKKIRAEQNKIDNPGANFFYMFNK